MTHSLAEQVPQSRGHTEEHSKGEVRVRGQRGLWPSVFGEGVDGTEEDKNYQGARGWRG